MRNITYAIDTDTDLVVSRVGDEFAWPILGYDEMTPENNFETSYHLEKIRMYDIPGSAFRGFIYTKKIPIEIKNLHRAFWGFKPLKTKQNT